MTRSRQISSAVLGLISVGATLTVATSTAQLPRELATLVVVAGPGMAWVPLLDLHDLAFEALLCLLCSVTAVILAAQAVTYASAFSWRPVEFSLLAITAAGLSAQALLSLTHARRTER
jgi:hypothetical protein